MTNFIEYLNQSNFGQSFMKVQKPNKRVLKTIISSNESNKSKKFNFKEFFHIFSKKNLALLFMGYLP